MKWSSILGVHRIEVSTQESGNGKNFSNLGCLRILFPFYSSATPVTHTHPRCYCWDIPGRERFTNLDSRVVTVLVNLYQGVFGFLRKFAERCPQVKLRVCSSSFGTSVGNEWEQMIDVCRLSLRSACRLTKSNYELSPDLQSSSRCILRTN